MKMLFITDTSLSADSSFVLRTHTHTPPQAAPINSRTFCISFLYHFIYKMLSISLANVFFLLCIKKQPFQIHITYQAHLRKSQEFVITFGKDFFFEFSFFFSSLARILFCDFKDAMQKDISPVRHG